MSSRLGPSSHPSQQRSQRQVSLSPRASSSIMAPPATSSHPPLPPLQTGAAGGMYSSPATDDGGESLEGLDVEEDDFSDLYDPEGGAVIEYDDEDDDDVDGAGGSGGRGQNGRSGARQTRRRRSSASIGSTGKPSATGGPTSPRSPRRANLRQKNTSGGNRLTTPERRPNSSGGGSGSGPRVSPLAKRLGEEPPFMLPHPSKAKETSNMYPGVIIGAFAGGGDDATLGFGVEDMSTMDMDDILDRSAAGASGSGAAGGDPGAQPAGTNIAPWLMDDGPVSPVPNKVTPEQVARAQQRKQSLQLNHFSSVPHLPKIRRHGTMDPHAATFAANVGASGSGAGSGAVGGENPLSPLTSPKHLASSRDGSRSGSDPAVAPHGLSALTPASGGREGRSRNGSQDSMQTINFAGPFGPFGPGGVSSMPGSSNTSLGGATTRSGKRGTSPSGSFIDLPPGSAGSSLAPSRHGSVANTRVSRFGSTASVASSHGAGSMGGDKKKGGFLGSLLKRKTGQSMSQGPGDFTPMVHRGSASDSASSRLSTSTSQSSLNKVTSADWGTGSGRSGSHASDRGGISPLHEIGEQEFQLDMNLDDMEGIVDPTFALAPAQPPPAAGPGATNGTPTNGAPPEVLQPGQSGATTASDVTNFSLSDALHNTSSFATTISEKGSIGSAGSSSGGGPVSKSPGRSVVAPAQRESGAFSGRPDPFQTPGSSGSTPTPSAPSTGGLGSSLGEQLKPYNPPSPHSVSPKHNLPPSTQPRRPSQLRNVKTGSLDSEASSEASGPLQPLAPSWAQSPTSNQPTLFHDPFGTSAAQTTRASGRAVSPSRPASLTPVPPSQGSFSDDPSATQRPTTASSAGHPAPAISAAAAAAAAAAWAAPESWGVEADAEDGENTTSSSSGSDDEEWADDATPGSATPAAAAGTPSAADGSATAPGAAVAKDGAAAGAAGLAPPATVSSGQRLGGTSGDGSKPPPFGAKSLAKKAGARPTTAGGKKSKVAGRPSTANRPGTGGRPGTSGSTHMVSVNHFTRIYRADGSYSVMAFPLLTTTAEIINTLAGGADGKKVSTSMRLYVRERGQDRQLLPSEKPLGIQARRLAQAGYTDAEHIEEVGKEDLSLLCKFIYQTPVLPVMNPDEESSYESFEFIDIAGRDLQVIPIFLHLHAHNIIILNVSRNPMTDLPLDFIQACSSLKELKMSNMALKRVPASIRASTTLARLDLSCNRIADLESVQLNEIASLLSLKVQNNKLTSIPTYFAMMKSLKYLNISNNNFETFPTVVCEMSNLVDLDASFNQIAELPSEMSNLKSLERLSVVGNELTSFPKSFSTLENLRVLDVRRNKLTDLTSVYALPNLATLRADSNDLVTLDAQLGAKVRDFSVPHNSITRFTLASFPGMTQAYSLTSLDLSHGKLSTLADGALAELVNLIHLNLNFNQFTRLPSTFGYLQNLETFSATDNMINLIPQGFGQLTKLRLINLHNNNLKEIPSDMWMCPALETFNASSNLLETLADPPAAWVEQMAQAQAADPGRKMSTVSTMSNSTDRNRMVPPAGHSCKYIFLADNRLTDDVFHQISLLYNMRTLNLSFNDIHEIPPYTLSRCDKLEALYVSGNKLTSLPTEDLERLHNLKSLYLNGNKLQTLPSELGAIKGLQHLDVGSNVLKYNIANWPYDWNWNWNTALRYLNLSGNKRLEIKPTSGQDLSHASSFRKELSDFTALTDLRVLGLMDVTLRIPSLPDETDEKRIRTSFSDINNMAYGISDTLGSIDHLAMFDLAVPNFRGKDNECVFGMFGRAAPAVPSGKIPKYIQENFASKLADELDFLRADEAPTEALRRSFLYINKDCFDFLAGTEKRRKGSDASYITVNSLRTNQLSNISSQLRTGSSGAVVYLVDKTLHVANAGDTLVVLSRKGEAELLSKRHDPTDREETARIRRAEAWVSTKGWVNDDKEIDISRAFGFYHASPAINASPEVRTRDLAESDEFVIIGNHALWKCCSYQTAVDIARTERDDPMMAAQKLRDFAISYGAEGSIMVMVVNISDLFFGRGFGRVRGMGSGPQQAELPAESEWAKARTNRRRAEEVGDRTLNRLQQEVEPPTGQVAIVFTDIVNSTALWETNPGMPTAIKMHHSLMRRQLRLDGGYEVKTEGDSFMVSFPSVTAAVLWAFNCQIQLLSQEWPRELLESEDGKVIYDSEGNVIHRGLRVRMGVHWGSPECERDPITRRMDYYGPMVNRSARINASADGGQLMASQDVIMEIQQLIDASDEAALDDLFPDTKREAAELRRMGVVMKNMGERKLKGLEVPEKLQLLYPKPLAGRLELFSGLRANVEVNEAKTFSTQRQNDINEVRQLVTLTLRLEALSSLASSNAVFPHSGPSLGRDASHVPGSPRSPAPMSSPKMDYSPSAANGTPGLGGSGSGSGSGTHRSPGNTKTPSMPASAAMVDGKSTSGQIVPRSNTHQPSAFLGPTVRDDMTDEELCEIIESLTTRIENVLSTLYIKHLGGFASVLAALEKATRIDSNLLVHAMSLMSGAMSS